MCGGRDEWREVLDHVRATLEVIEETLADGRGSDAIRLIVAVGHDVETLRLMADPADPA